MFRNKKELLIVLLIPIIFFVYAIYTIGDYGINWDEPYHFRRGQAFLQYFLTGKKTYDGMPKYPPLKGSSDSPGFRDSEKHFEEVQKNPSLSDPSFRRSYYQDDAWNGEYHLDIEDPSGHPALGGILASLFNKIFYQKLGILGDLESYHLLEITIASLLVFAVAIFTLKEFGVVESVISSLALSTYPLFLGEQHFNIKDPVEAAFYTLTLLSAYKAITKKSALWLLITSFTFALALSVKFNIVFIIIPLAVWGAIYFYKHKSSFKLNKKFTLAAIVSPFIILGLFVLFFPTLWESPIWGIGRMVEYYLKVGYSLSQSPNYYLWGFVNIYPVTWIFYTTPIVTLILFILFFLFPKKIFKNKMFPFLLLMSLIVTIARITFFGAISYGGVRLIMEFIPIMAIICGVAAGEVAKRLDKIPKPVFMAIILLLYLPTILKMISIHPNENVFFNSFAGGLSGAKAKQINSWGNSNGNAYFPALLWLNENAEPNAKLALPVGSTSNIPRYKLRKDISLSWNYWSGPRHEGEYVIELTYDYQPMQWYSLKYLNTAMKPVYEVKVDGVAIAKLWKNSPEYLLPEFAKEKVIGAKISPKEGFLELTLPQAEEIMHISLRQPSKKCAALKTGYLATSLDGKNWIRETEDLARDQLQHAKLRDLEEKFDFYLVAKEAKYIRLHAENKDACLFAATKAEVSVLADN